MSEDAGLQRRSQTGNASKTETLDWRNPPSTAASDTQNSDPHAPEVDSSAVQKRRNLIELHGEVFGISSSRPGTLEVVPQRILHDALVKIHSTKFSDKFGATQSLRILLSMKENPPTESIIKMGFLRPLVQLLDQEIEIGMQFEAAWCIANIAACEPSHTLAVVAEGSLKPLISLVESPHVHIAHQALWAIGNIVADNGHFRDLAIEAGLLPKLIYSLDDRTPIVIVRTVSWILVNICRTKKPRASAETVSVILPRIFGLMGNDNIVVRLDAIWCLAYLSDGPQDLMMEDLVVSGILNNILLTRSEKFLFGALRLIGNLLSGPDNQCEAVIATDCLSELAALLDHRNVRIQKEVLLCFGNIAAGTPDQIQKIFDIHGLVYAAVHRLSDERILIHREAVWMFANIAQGGNCEQVTKLLDFNVLVPLCDLLSTRDLSVLRITLETMNNIVKMCGNKDGNLMRLTMESCGGVEKVENLQHHDNEIVYQLSYEIIDCLFNEDDNLDESFLAHDAAAHKFSIPRNTEN